MLKYFKYFSEDDIIIKSLDYALDRAINNLCGFNKLEVDKYAGGKVYLSGNTNFKYSSGTIIFLEFSETNNTIPVEVLDWKENYLIAKTKRLKNNYFEDYTNYNISPHNTCYDLTNFGESTEFTPFLQYFFSNIFVKYGLNIFLDKIGEWYSTLRYLFTDDNIYRNIITTYAFTTKSTFQTVENFFDWYFYRLRKHTKLTEPPLKRRLAVLWSSDERILDETKQETYVSLWDLYADFVFSSGSDSQYIMSGSNIQRFKYQYSNDNDKEYLNTRFDTTNYRSIWSILFNSDNIKFPTTIPTITINNDTEINENTIQKTVYPNLFNLNYGFVVINTYLDPDRFPAVDNINVIRDKQNYTNIISWSYTNGIYTSTEPTGFYIERWYTNQNIPQGKVVDLTDWNYLDTITVNYNTRTYTHIYSGSNYTFGYRIYPSGSLPTNKGILIT